MNKTFITAAFGSLFWFSIGFAQSPGQIKILFDCTKAESAGSADWVMDADLDNLNWTPNAVAGGGGYHSNPQQYPTPTQTAITSSTAESYWTGGLSYWGIDCVKKGYWVETLGPFASLTYGNTSNPQDLSNYNVFIVDEPNILFTVAQKIALMNFVLNGGGLFMISDHNGSDRNNDGYDSPHIWNDFITNNGVQNNSFGFIFDLQNFSGQSYNVANLPGDSILHGPMGNVTEVKWSNGTSMTLNPSQNASITGAVYNMGASNPGIYNVLCAYARMGCGKVAAIGDSSPPDDGTGNPAVTSGLYNGYIQDAAGNHQLLLMNITMWLAKSNCVAGIGSVEEQSGAELYPNPADEQTIFRFSNSGSANSGLVIYNTSGQVMNTPYNLVKNSEDEEFAIDTKNLPAGIFFCRLTIGDKTLTRKLVVSAK